MNRISLLETVKEGLFVLWQAVILWKLFDIVPPIGVYESLSEGKILYLAALTVFWLTLSSVIGKHLQHGVIGLSIPQLSIPIVWVLALLRMPLRNDMGIVPMWAFATIGVITLLFGMYSFITEKKCLNEGKNAMVVASLCTLIGTVAFIQVMYNELFPIMVTTDTSLLFAIKGLFQYNGRLQVATLTAVTGLAWIIVWSFVNIRRRYRW